MMERRRPPRLVSGDGKLLPLVRGGSTKQVQWHGQQRDAGQARRMCVARLAQRLKRHCIP